MSGLMKAEYSACPTPAGERSPAPNSTLQWLALFAAEVARDQSPVSASTLEAYILDVTTLSRWAVDQRKDLLGLTTRDLTRYLNDRLVQGIRPSTLARHLSSYRRFYAFLMSQGVRSANPAAAVPRPQMPRNEPRLLPDTALCVLLRPPVRPHESVAAAYRAQRDYTIVCLLYGTSLPISDVRLLRWHQIDAQGRIQGVTRGNREARHIVLDAGLLAAVNALRGCLQAADFIQPNNPYCFSTASGKPMTRQGLCQVVHKWARERGLELVVTPSGIRQTGLAHRALQPKLALKH